jgi:hypothetical protein
MKRPAHPLRQAPAAAHVRQPHRSRFRIGTGLAQKHRASAADICSFEATRHSQLFLRRRAALFYGRAVSDAGHDVEPDLAIELELRDELLVACRQLLIGMGTREAAALVAHIDALLDLDDEVSPGSQR